MTADEIAAHDLRAAQERIRRFWLPAVGSCLCCNAGVVRRWPTGALECDNPRCSIMGADITEFNAARKAHMRVDVLQLTSAEIDALH